MTFQHLLDGAEFLAQSGDASISSIEYDSRRVKPGCLFVAMHGETSDGNRFIDAAIQAGAVAVVTDSPTETPRPGVAWAVVPHGRRALARVSENFYRRPAEHHRDEWEEYDRVCDRVDSDGSGTQECTDRDD
jgi:UDP-N-acetylmuramoyl-L-alanyl-D-glutamate--2,6-diaminopimelate ligase